MHRERHRGELESTEIICEVTIVHYHLWWWCFEEWSSRESGGSHHFSTIGGLSSSWHRFGVVGQFIEDSSEII